MPLGESNLGDGLILRSVRDERDVERYCELNETVLREGAIGERLLHHHPETHYDHYFLVEDSRTGRVVSTTCLLPWRCHYEELVLEMAQLEMVVTHPDYRRRGLIRAQVRRFHDMARERGFDLCIIGGIPHYYRQYGYSYALDNLPTDALPPWRIPERTEDTPSPYRLREATPADAATLATLYERAMAVHQIYALRSVDYWHYLLRWMRLPIRLVEDARTGQAVGYIRLAARSGGLWVGESAIPNYDVGLAVLQQLKAEATGEIRLVGTTADILVRIGRSLGSTPLPSDQWLLRFLDIAGFIRKIGPLLERRLAHAGCADLTADLCLNLYREAFLLRFEGGKLLHVEPLGFVDASLNADGGDFCLPLDAFVRLAMGYRSLEELRDAWPDIVVKRERHYILEALFPRLDAFVSLPY